MKKWQLHFPPKPSSDQSLNSKSFEIISMCEILERKQAHPYESDADKTDEEIVEGLMEITALSLTDVTADEPAYEWRPEKRRYSFSTLILFGPGQQ